MSWLDRMNEEETRLLHIDSALKAVGWSVIEGSRIRPEYPITRVAWKVQTNAAKP